MRISIKYGIRTQLFILLLLLTVPFLVYVATSYVREAASDRQQAEQRMLAAARITAARLDDHIGDIEQLLKVLAHVVGAKPSDTDSNDALLRSMTGSLPPHINDISVWNAAGENIGSLNVQLRSRAVNISASPAFKAAMLGREVSIDAPIRSPFNAEWIGAFTVPVFRDDVVVAVVSASTRLGRLQDLLAPKSALPAGAIISVSDDRGRMLARSVDPDKWIGADVSRQGYFKTAIGQREGTDEGPGAEGVVRIAGFTTSQRVPWLVYAAAPSSSILSELRARTSENLMVGFGMLVLASLLAVWVSGRIARPLRQLSEDAATIGEGRLEHRIEARYGGEVGVLADTLNRMITALQERSDSLERSQEQLRQITDNVPALVSYLDLEKRFVFANRAYQDWLNFDPKDMIGRTLSQQYGAERYATFAHYIDKALTGERVVYERELPTTMGLKYVQVTAVPHFTAAGKVQGLHVLMHDITQRKINEERLRQLAEFDLLTSLPNRGLFLDRLKQGMAQASRSGRPMALLLLDIDHFKTVNDTHGHAAGDDLLRAFGRRLLDAVRPTDTVARLSGDEFAIVLLDVKDMSAAGMVANKIVEAIRVPMTIRDQELRITTSIGIALCEPGDGDGPALMARADAALYDAKARGRDTWFCETRPLDA